MTTDSAALLPIRADDLQALLDERDRLREALTFCRDEFENRGMWNEPDGHDLYEVARAALAQSEEARPPRFDHGGMWRHHHDVDTAEPVWWENVERFGGEKVHHVHHHAAQSEEARP